MEIQVDVAPYSKLEAITFYIGPTHVATFHRVVAASENPEERCRFLFVFWKKGPQGAQDESCLIIASEELTKGAPPVLVVYDHTSRTELEADGDWAEVGTFERKAISLASERLATRFTERPPRAGRPK
jgi:hypothetical protein